MSQTVTIKIGQSGESFVLANGRERIRIKREPAGLNFYEFDWPRSHLGTVRVEHGIHTFSVGNVLGGTGTEDTELLHEGLTPIHFWAGIIAPETIPHIEARDRIMALLQSLRAAGWRRNITRSDPRFKARQAVAESINQLGLYSLDPDYTPTMQEWMSLGNHAIWEHYAEGIYMTVDFRRDQEHMNPNLPGAYLLGFKLTTEAEEMQGYFAPDDKKRWKELWPARNSALQQERAAAEVKARAQGLEIDTTYQDPPILALQVARLTAKVGQPAPKAGWWKASSATNNTRIWNLEALERTVPERLKLGEPLSSLSPSMMNPKTIAAQDADTVWTWIKE